MHDRRHYLEGKCMMQERVSQIKIIRQSDRQNFPQQLFSSETGNHVCMGVKDQNNSVYYTSEVCVAQNFSPKAAHSADLQDSPSRLQNGCELLGRGGRGR